MSEAVQLHISEHGSSEQGSPSGAPPVVFTHGWLDTGDAWDDVVAALAPTVRSLTWDLRGHGRSAAPPPGNYTRADALGDLERVVAQAGTPVVLAGHSLGGYLALAHALNHPDEVAALVLIAAGPGFRKDEAREQWNEAVDKAAAKAEVPEGSEDISKHVDAWVIDHLGDIACPTLVIVGEYDKRFAASAAIFEKHLDVRTSIVVPDTGHAVHRKAGAAVAEAIASFLAEVFPAGE